MEGFQVIDQYLLVRMPKEVDHHRAGYISQQADWYITQQEINDIVFDFAQTQFMDSSGIGILMGRYKKVSCFGGKIYVIHADRHTKRLLSLAGLEHYVKILEDNQNVSSGI